MDKALSLLMEAYECGILDATEVAEKLYMTKQKFVKEHHKYSISKRKDGRCITTLRREGEDRQQISAPTYSELINKLYDYYNEKKYDYTVFDLFKIWVEARMKQALLEIIDIKTVRRDEQHWNKYYKDSNLITMPVRKVTTKKLNEFLNDSITTHKLSRKEYNNMKTILIAVFRIAIDKEILAVNPMSNIHVDVKFRSIQKKRDGSKLYLEKEMEKLEEFLYEKKTVEAYSILMHFQLGTRIGELVVLKFEDMLDDEAYIHKMEISDVEKQNGHYVSKGFKIVEYVKHDIASGYRTIPLSDKAKKILLFLQEVNKDYEYLFTTSKGKRMTSRCFAYWLRMYCTEAGIPYKSSHCIRRTFASRLFAAGMPLEEIATYMGHEDIETTKRYIYNYKSVEENRAYMNKAL